MGRVDISHRGQNFLGSLCPPSCQDAGHHALLVADRGSTEGTTDWSVRNAPQPCQYSVRAHSNYSKFTSDCWAVLSLVSCLLSAAGRSLGWQLIDTCWPTVGSAPAHPILRRLAPSLKLQSVVSESGLLSCLVSLGCSISSLLSSDRSSTSSILATVPSLPAAQSHRRPPHAMTSSAWQAPEEPPQSLRFFRYFQHEATGLFSSLVPSRDVDLSGQRSRNKWTASPTRRSLRANDQTPWITASPASRDCLTKSKMPLATCPRTISGHMQRSGTLTLTVGHAHI